MLEVFTDVRQKDSASLYQLTTLNSNFDVRREALRLKQGSAPTPTPKDTYAVYSAQCMQYHTYDELLGTYTPFVNNSDISMHRKHPTIYQLTS